MVYGLYPPVGAAEGCDLLILKIKRSQPRFTRQLLQVQVLRRVSGAKFPAAVLVYKDSPCPCRLHGSV